MAQAKPPGEKYVSQHFMLPPDIAAWMIHGARRKKYIALAILAGHQLP
jgi:hypothetical protein